MNDHVEDTQNTHNKLVELEDCSRRNNIKIDRVKEDSKETWEESERRVHSMLKEVLDLKNMEIERVHRTVGRNKALKKLRKNNLFESQNHPPQG